MEGCDSRQSVGHLQESKVKSLPDQIKCNAMQTSQSIFSKATKVGTKGAKRPTNRQVQYDAKRFGGDGVS